MVMGDDGATMPRCSQDVHLVVHRDPWGVVLGFAYMWPGEPGEGPETRPVVLE